MGPAVHTAYKIEISPNKRAGCKVKHCKDAGTKIEKGELRLATLVPYDDSTYWAYRHWGCVTPEVLKNLEETLNGDFELLYGFDDLEEDVQEKVVRAIAEHHVDDDDWNGDVEMNRHGMGRGMFLTDAARKRLEKERVKNENLDDIEQDNAPKKSKKRSRVKKEDDEDEHEAPAPKKSRGKNGDKAVKAESKDEAEVKPKKTRGKRAVPKIESDEDAITAGPEAPAHKGKKSHSKKAVSEVESDEERASTAELNEDPPARKPKRGKKSKAAVEDADQNDQDPEPTSRPKRGRKAKTIVKNEPAAFEEPTAIEEHVPAPQSKRDKRGSRKAKAAVKTEEAADTEYPVTTEGPTTLEEPETAPMSKHGRKSMTAVKNEELEVEADASASIEEPNPAPRLKRGSKSNKAVETEEPAAVDSINDEPNPPARPKRGRKAKAVVEAASKEPKEAPRKRSGKVKA